MQKKLIIVQKLKEDLQQKIADIVSEDWEIIQAHDKELSPEELQEAEVIAGWNKEVEQACLTGEANLKWAQSWSAGVDSYPLKKLAERDILLTSANGVHAYPISETIFALMLGLTRKIHSYVRNQTEKKWHHAGLKLELHEKTIGILGMGAIGKETAKIAKAFGMNVLGIRNSDKPEEHVDQMFQMDQLHDVLPECDYVVITLPLTNDTRGLFSREQFELMKESSFFVNIGRGEIVDEPALIKALEDNQIAGAGLDVFEKEPIEDDNPLWEFENVIVTPHTAGATEFYNKRLIEDIFIPNLKKYLDGENPSVNLVDFQKGY